MTGIIGKDLDVNAGRKAAHTAALNALALAKKHLGTLNRVTHVVRLGVYMAATRVMLNCGWQMTRFPARDMILCMSASVVSVNKNVQGGTPCFVGTRVPVASLFDHLEGGYTIDYFLTQFPSVTREQVVALLEEAKARTEDARLAPT